MTILTNNQPTTIRIIRQRRNGWKVVKTIKEKIFRIVHQSEIKGK